MEETGLVNLVLAIGALGAAAFGLVEVVRTLPFGRAWGFSRIRRDLQTLAPVLSAAYGEDWLTLIREQYIDGRAKGDAPESIRQGVRAGLTLAGDRGREDWLEEIARYAGGVSGEELNRVWAVMRHGEDLPAEMETAYSRFELGMDLKLRAAFAEADRRFRADAIRWASAIAIGLSIVGFGLVGGWLEAGAPGPTLRDFLLSILVGIAAVPLAPVSKDLASAISAAAHAARSASGR